MSLVQKKPLPCCVPVSVNASDIIGFELDCSTRCDALGLPLHGNLTTPAGDIIETRGALGVGWNDRARPDHDLGDFYVQVIESQA